MLYSGMEVDIAFHVVESNIITVADGVVVDQANHDFWHITGLDHGGQIYGVPGIDLHELTVPQDWADRLAEYIRQHTLVVDNSLRPARNCHAFARFMQGDDSWRSDAPARLVDASGPITSPSDELSFGQLALLCRQAKQKNAPNPHRRPPAFVKPEDAKHSVIALGNQASNLCLQVTSYNGFLALDEYAPIAQDYEAYSSAEYVWYAAQQPPEASYI